MDTQTILENIRKFIHDNGGASNLWKLKISPSISFPAMIDLGCVYKCGIYENALYIKSQLNGITDVSLTSQTKLMQSYYISVFK
jgi:hypothetical protein